MSAHITRIAGPVVNIEGIAKPKIGDLVKVGHKQLMAEIIKIEGLQATAQVYEETTGLAPGEPAEVLGMPLSVELGPGILGMVYDGTQRPLDTIKEQSGVFIAPGMSVPALDRKKKWSFTPTKKDGDKVSEGDIIGEVQETSLITHKVLVPPGISGKISGLKKGNYTVEQNIATVGKETIQLMQKWPVRKARPVSQRLAATEPLISGQRVLDTFFPIPKGSAAAIPGPFGAGKTVTQQQLARWSDADIIIYVGCGERGNEMTDVLEEFPELKDPKTGKPLMDRTVLIANTSNMPVAAREASVYTGITLAEYYRDMGYRVALMADSTSRWAEAMREISGRLEEMPGEEGYPAYLARRLAEFYERAGRVTTLSGDSGAVSVIGAVSPPGGDFSEPVTQNTLRLVKAFWALDAKLANRRHFPSINWLTSYSLAIEATKEWFNENVDPEWDNRRAQAMKLLQQEKELLDIAQLVGLDALPQEQQLVLLTSKILREDYLQQNAFHEDDSYCSLEKQALMLQTILTFHEAAGIAITKGKKVASLRSSPLMEELGRMKYDNVKNIKKLLEKVRGV